MSTNAIIAIITAALGGGGLGAFLSFKINNRKQDNSDFVVIINEYKALVNKTEERVSKLENELKSLRTEERANQKEINSLRNQLIIFESSHTDIPLPMWMKDATGKMIFLNNEYEDNFLKPRGYNKEDYLFKDDYSVWSSEVAQQFISNDKEVIKTKRPIRKVELIEDGKGGFYYADLLKYPRFHLSKVIGVSGIIVNTALRKDQLEINK